MKIFKHQKEKSGSVIINLARLLFACLIIFELLNFCNILDFSLEFTWLGLIMTTTISLALLEIIAYKYKKKKGHRLHWSIWLIVLAGLGLDAAGNIFHFYGQYGWWDQSVHLFISAIVCLILFTIINAFWLDKFKFSLLFRSGRLKLSLLLAATLTMSLSALYELEEYLEYVFFHIPRLGLGTDTANDLLLNLIGVLIVAIFITIYCQITHKRKILG